jgi:hypothetical protein
VGARYGLNLHKDDPEGLTKIYGQYLESLIPAGRWVHSNRGAGYQQHTAGNQQVAQRSLAAARAVMEQGSDTREQHRAATQQEEKTFDHVPACALQSEGGVCPGAKRSHGGICERQAAQQCRGLLMAAYQALPIQHGLLHG